MAESVNITPNSPIASAKGAFQSQIDPEPMSLVFTVAAASIGGMLLAVLVLPAWLPSLTASILAPEPKVFWYISRASAVVAYSMLFISMVLGLLMTGKLAQTWPGAAAANEFHQFNSLLALFLGAFHGLILMGDKYIHYTLMQVLLPFASQNYRPEWVGLGQISLYLTLITVLSFYVRRRIGNKAWRAIHLVTFAAFVMVLVHGIASGTDVTSPVLMGYYWVSGAVVLFLTVYRVLFAWMRKLPQAQGQKAG
jgi:predicted ferric reductase